MAREASIFDDDEDDGLDVSGFSPKSPEESRRADPAAIRGLALQRGFTERDPPPSLAKPAGEGGQVRRHRTGRTAHCNIRTSPSYKARFEELADANGLSLAQAFEAAVDLLDKATRSAGE